MRLLDYDVFIAASPTAIFRVIADPRSKLAWVPAIRRVQIEGEGGSGPGTKYLASSAAGPFEFVFHEQIVEWVEDRRVAYVGRSPWGRFRTTATIRPQDEGAYVHYHMDYVFPLGLLGAVIGQIVALFIRRPMEAKASIQLKRVVEGELWKPESTWSPRTKQGFGA